MFKKIVIIWSNIFQEMHIRVTEATNICFIKNEVLHPNFWRSFLLKNRCTNVFFNWNKNILRGFHFFVRIKSIHARPTSVSTICCFKFTFPRNKRNFFPLLSRSFTFHKIYQKKKKHKIKEDNIFFFVLSSTVIFRKTFSH